MCVVGAFIGAEESTEVATLKVFLLGCADN